MGETTQTAEVIYSILGGDPDLGELVGMFVDEMPDRVSNIQTLLEARDWEELRRAAHQLKGAAGSYGFETISPFAARVEDAIREDEAEEEVYRAAVELCELCRRARAGTPE